jgi:4-amino-4-deoxy-L-arabinose transferase-like glycosyltransferase
MKTSGRGDRSHRDLLFSAWLGLLALLPRLYVAIAWPREPVWDGHYYDFGARRIASGFGYSDGTDVWHPWCHWPVGYSGALAAVYRVFGAGPHVATVFNAVSGALLAVFVHRFARYELSSGRARVAGLLCALYPGLIVYSALVMTEPLSALAVVVAGWLWVRYRQTRPHLGAALFGLTLGVGTLLHPTFIAYAPALVLMFGDTMASSLRMPVLRQSLTASAIATACAFVPVVPWTIRNCRVMDRCTLVSTNGGWNLAIGSFSRATGRFETLHASDGCALVTGQVQQDACWRDLAIESIRKNPVRWLALVPKKLGYTFDHESFAVEYLHEADPDRWPEDRRRLGRGWLTTAHRLLLTLAAFALVPLALARSRKAIVGAVAVGTIVGALVLWAWLSDNSPFYLVAAAIAMLGWFSVPGSPPPGPVVRWAFFSVAGTLMTHAVFFGEDRYHLVVTPMLCLLAAAALRNMPKTPSPSHMDRDRLGPRAESLG